MKSSFLAKFFLFKFRNVVNIDEKAQCLNVDDVQRRENLHDSENSL